MYNDCSYVTYVQCTYASVHIHRLHMVHITHNVAWVKLEPHTHWYLIWHTLVHMHTNTTDTHTCMRMYTHFIHMHKHILILNLRNMYRYISYIKYYKYICTYHYHLRYYSMMGRHPWLPSLHCSSPPVYYMES